MAYENLKSFTLFRRLDDSALAMIRSRIIVQNSARHDVIIFEGDEDQALYLINKGGVKVNQINFEGNEVVINTLGAGDFFGEMAIINRETRSANVVATENTEIYKLGGPDFLQLLHAHSTIAIALLQRMSVRLKKCDKRINELSLNFAESRIAMSLINTARQAGKVTNKHVVIDGIPYKDELAQMACTSRQVVEETLSNFKKQGIIAEQEDRLLIFDFNKFIKDFS